MIKNKRAHYGSDFSKYLFHNDKESNAIIKHANSDVDIPATTNSQWGVSWGLFDEVDESQIPDFYKNNLKKMTPSYGLTLPPPSPGHKPSSNLPP